MEAIWFTYSEKPFFSKDQAMKNMQRLRILCISKENEDDSSDSNSHDGSTDGSTDDSTDVSTDDSIEYLSNNLCWFVWHEYPWKLLPRNFNPRRLVHVDLRWSSLHYLWKETKLLQFPSLQRIDLSGSKNLKRTPNFEGMPNLKYLNLEECTSLEEVHPSLKDCEKLMQLNLSSCITLERFPYVNVESLESLNLRLCSSLENFPEILGGMKQGTAIKITTSYSGIRLHLNGMENIVSLPRSICKLKGLVSLDVSYCSKLISLPEEIGDLENLEYLHASYTLISRPPSSIVWLNKLKSLDFRKQKSEDGVYFVFPLVNEGLLSLKYLDLSYCNIINGRLPKDIGSLSSLKELTLSYCNIIDGGLPEDIGSLSSLKKLNLRGSNFVHLPRSISELGALQTLDLPDCKRLRQLPEFPQQLDTIYADWTNASICNSLFQNISSLQHDICSSELRVFRSLVEDIPSWFNYPEMCPTVLVGLPENWYESDKFLGLAVCYSSKYYIDYITTDLIPLSCDDGMSSMTQEFALSNNSELDDPDACNINFLLVPLDGLWDASKANGKTPNDYGCIEFDFSVDR